MLFAPTLESSDSTFAYSSGLHVLLHTWTTTLLLLLLAPLSSWNRKKHRGSFRSFGYDLCVTQIEFEFLFLFLFDSRSPKEYNSMGRLRVVVERMWIMRMRRIWWSKCVWLVRCLQLWLLSLDSRDSSKLLTNSKLILQSPLLASCGFKYGLLFFCFCECFSVFFFWFGPKP